MESCVLVFPGKPGLRHSADKITSQDFHLFPLLSFYFFFVFEIDDVKFPCNKKGHAGSTAGKQV